jgi:UDP-glucose 4-epimerase
MRLLITGGCGFIGVNLVHRLLAPDNQILLLDDQSAGRLDDLRDVAGGVRTVKPDGLPQRSEKGVWFIAGDIRDAGLTRAITANLDAIVHLAAHTEVVNSVQNPRYDADVNVVGTLNLLEAARIHGVRKFIFASSAATLGEQDPPLDEEKPLKPLSPYGAGKVAGEAYCSAYSHCYGVQAVALRFSNVYGPRSFHKGSAISHFIKEVLQGRPLVVFGDGEQTRDFLYVDDLTDAISVCLSSAPQSIAGQVIQIATGRETSVNQVAAIIQDLASGSGLKVNVVHEAARPGEIYRNYSNIDKARRLLGYDPKTGLREGIRATWEWFKGVWHALEGTS